MTEYDCPLCSNDYERRRELRVHLEVKHRKSEIVSHLVESTGSDDPVLEGERRAPPL
ncbi:hypothetical protein [Natronococcus jeotgali]|uniref:C2H2-type domain-containing protein n=1 Tax=Natronococcus jeotgali DSM 18795 TaxID=1227498 RepID=L9X549_9EURY|nr:hypothetical protein [Natronococcus jeotgali]ELY56566.1 hypothetical protein C492_14486 [Natronococcus jeotgali DSM 18795]